MRYAISFYSPVFLTFLQSPCTLFTIIKDERMGTMGAEIDMMILL